MADEGRPGLTGLQQLEALIASGRPPSIATTMGFDLVEISEARAVFEGAPGGHVLNPLGQVHGGYAATLLDSACGCAVHARLGPTQAYTTLELKVSYLRGMGATTGRVRAEGTVTSIGRRVAFAEARLAGADGKLYATATSTLLVFER